MATYLFTSHDGFGLGHVRRNMLIAQHLCRGDRTAQAIVVTGVQARLPWLAADNSRIDVVRVPSLIKDHTGLYRNDTLDVATALRCRTERFAELIEVRRPDVVVVDRHPFGIDGELRAGLQRCRELGIPAVLGLRDILDDAATVRAELAGASWAGAADAFDEIVVYGARHLCDHEAEYGLFRTPTYTGWVADDAVAASAAGVPERDASIDRRTLVIAAGGGGDGGNVLRVGIDLIRRKPDWSGVLVTGPHARGVELPREPDVRNRLRVVSLADGCRQLLARSGASVQMAGYNTTIEALTSGIRPILVPRRAPRREQAIRAARLASLGLADIVDDGAGAAELTWLLNRPRRLGPSDLERAQLCCDGAARTARVVRSLAGRSVGRLVAAR